MSVVVQRYVSSLLGAAVSRECLDELGADLASLAELVEQSDEFAGFLADPMAEPETSIRVIDALFAGKACPLTLSFLHLLTRRHRLADLPDMLPLALERWRDAKGILQVDVVSSGTLTAQQRKELQQRLGKRTGKEIELICSEDDRLIGGFRLEMKDVVEDYSLAAKLETFKRNVINA